MILHCIFLETLKQKTSGNESTQGQASPSLPHPNVTSHDHQCFWPSVQTSGAVPSALLGEECHDEQIESEKKKKESFTNGACIIPCMEPCTQVTQEKTFARYSVLKLVKS